MKFTKIAEVRERRGMKQGELATLSGISRSTITDMERGKAKDCRVSVLHEIAKVLECQMEELYDKEDRG